MTSARVRQGRCVGVRPAAAFDTSVTSVTAAAWRVQNNGYLVVMSNMTRVKGGTASSDAYGQARLAPQSPAIGMRSPAHPGMGGPLGLQSPQHNPCAPPCQMLRLLALLGGKGYH